MPGAVFLSYFICWSIFFTHEPVLYCLTIIDCNQSWYTVGGQVPSWFFSKNILAIFSTLQFSDLTMNLTNTIKSLARISIRNRIFRSVWRCIASLKMLTFPINKDSMSLFKVLLKSLSVKFYIFLHKILTKFSLNFLSGFLMFLLLL